MRVSTGGWGNFIPVFLSALGRKVVSLGGIHVYLQLIHKRGLNRCSRVVQVVK
jgi:hypothetical protein